ncbi:MAG: metallophosphoesterase, partial [Planctomycetaceae bacterium]|nr:metallophosphoesterase [Planctomycetaceae bacterium]
MQRRSFIQTASAAGLVCVDSVAEAETFTAAASGESFAIDDNKVTYFTNAVTRPVKVMVVADTHLFRDDERGKPYREFSGRMAKAYNNTSHFKTGQPTNPEHSFEAALERAKSEGIDLLALVGDIFSFPSEAAIDWVLERLTTVEMPWLYVAGNHDWHYEGMEGSLEQLRADWIKRRLKPMYQGNHPLMAVYEVHGVRFLAIDNSHYEILPEQLEFFRTEVRRGQPIVLFVHIPLYAPGRSMGFGCGHPDWGAATDRNYELERRP